MSLVSNTTTIIENETSGYPFIESKANRRNSLRPEKAMILEEAARAAIANTSEQIAINQQDPKKQENAVTNSTSPVSQGPTQERAKARAFLETAQIELAVTNTQLLSCSQVLTADGTIPSKTLIKQKDLEEKAEKLTVAIQEIQTSLTDPNLPGGHFQRQLGMYRNTIELNTKLLEQQEYLFSRQEIISRQLALEGRPRSVLETNEVLNWILARCLKLDEELSTNKTHATTVKYNKTEDSLSKGEMKDRLVDFQNRFTIQATEYEGLETEINNALAQLGTIACNSVINGEENTKLRAKIIENISTIAHFNYRLSLETNALRKEIKISHIKHLTEVLNAASKEIREFKRSANNVDLLWALTGKYYQVKEGQQAIYKDFTKTQLDKFGKLHLQCLTMHDKIRRQLLEFKSIKLNPNYPIGLANGSAGQAESNTEIFKKTHQAITEKENNIRLALLEARSQLLASHKELRSQLAFLTYMTGENNPSMTMTTVLPWRNIVTLETRELPSDPVEELKAVDDKTEKIVIELPMSSVASKAEEANAPSFLGGFFNWGSAVIEAEAAPTNTAADETQAFVVPTIINTTASIEKREEEEELLTTSRS
jgi:hypothetical protein